MWLELTKPITFQKSHSNVELFSLNLIKLKKNLYLKHGNKRTISIIKPFRINHNGIGKKGYANK